MRNSRKHVKRLVAAVIKAGGTTELVGPMRVKIYGPAGVAFCGGRDQGRQNLAALIRRQTGLTIKI